VPAEAQVDALKRRDCFAPCLLQGGNVTANDDNANGDNANAGGSNSLVSDPGRFPAFSGRSGVTPMHPDLEGNTLLVSGHHGTLSVPPSVPVSVLVSVPLSLPRAGDAPGGLESGAPGSGSSSSSSSSSRYSSSSDRIICDLSGGNPSAEAPITAVILPDRTVVGSSTANGGIVPQSRHLGNAAPTSKPHRK
jgi:hypothetical protein